MNFFSKQELACKHCLEKGRSVDRSYFFDEQFLEVLNMIRADVGFPLYVTSGYRCKDHPAEASKARPGAHNKGLAADLAVQGHQAYFLVESAVRHAVPRIGVSQNKDGPRFIHLDIDFDLPNPTIWSY